MGNDLPPFRRVVRNLRWYCEDVRTAITGKGKLHFAYDRAVEVGEHSTAASVNPATGLPMAGSSVDIKGNPFGIDLHK
jgi:hypothetical protein